MVKDGSSQTERSRLQSRNLYKHFPVILGISNLLQYKGDWIKAASKPFWASTMGDDGGIDNPIVVDVELD